MKYKDMEHLDVIHAVGGVGGVGGPSYHMFHWKQSAKENYDKAIAYLNQSIEAAPGFRDAYYRLGLVYLESDQPDGLIHTSVRLLDQVPDDKDALLFCGLGYQSTGDEEVAYEYYIRAVSLMGLEERAVMESVDLIATEEERKQIALANVQDTSQTWEDSAARARFWRRQDPLFLTGFNERPDGALRPDSIRKSSLQSAVEGD